MLLLASHSFFYFYSTALEVLSAASLYLVFQNLCPEVSTYGSVSSLTWQSSKPHVLMHHKWAKKTSACCGQPIEAEPRCNQEGMAPWVRRESTKRSQVVSPDREHGWLRMRTSVIQSLLSWLFFFLIEEPLNSGLEGRCWWFLFYILNLYFCILKPSGSVRLIAHLTVQDPQVMSILVY